MTYSAFAFGASECIASVHTRARRHMERVRTNAYAYNASAESSLAMEPVRI